MQHGRGLFRQSKQNAEPQQLFSIARRQRRGRKAGVMPLVDVPLPPVEAAVPRDVQAFLRKAERRLDRFQREFLVPAFVPSDFRTVYLTLRALSESDLAPGNLFCEWGSGFGVITCLRSEERRVGKECRSRRWASYEKKRVYLCLA